MLRAEGLRIGYGGRMLVEGLSLEFAAGQVWGILGRNGSGKSTLLRALAGLQPRTAGTVLLDGVGIDRMPRRVIATRMGVLLQEDRGEFWGSARDYVLLGRHPHSRRTFAWDDQDEEIADVELAAQDLTDFAHRPLETLSGGERQRSRLAALFAQRPRAYLADEPLQHLDLSHQVALMERVAAEARQGALAILVLHDLLLASRYCDHVLLLDGKAGHAAGPAAQILDAGRLGDAFGFPLEAIDVKGEILYLPQRPPHV